jgi:pimeloyl-ACP methyl ester carboxylesterase
LQVNEVGQKQLMIPFQVDPSWYEKYWWREPTAHRLSAFALLRRGLERFRRIQGSNVMTQAIRFEVSGATLECTIYGSGIPVVLLPNAGCSSGYFDDLARVLAAGGLQAICVNMRGTGESRGSLDGITVHNLAADVAGVLEALDCGPAHLVGHAFGNRVARCLAVDRPSLVRSVTLLAAGGLIAPSPPLGTDFRNATEVKMNGSDCVTVLGARWLSPASDPKILAHVECWPAVFLAHLATGRGVPLEDWWGAGTAPLLVIQGLDDTAAPPGNGHALREQFGERVRVIDLPRAGHFLVLEQPEAVTRAVAEFVGAGAPFGGNWQDRYLSNNKRN